MSQLNRKTIAPAIFTHENAKAVRVSDFESLKRSVLASMLWENNFYESGESVADRIVNLVPKIEPELVSQLAIDARNKYKLRHVPLLLTRELARHEKSRPVVEETLFNVIQRPDELSEFLSIYWKDKKQPLANCVKKGLAKAFTKFDEFSISRYNMDRDIKLRDVLFLVHPKAKNTEQQEVWNKLVNKTLGIADTWETRLSESKGDNKKGVWEGLLKDNALGALALLRNLRNMRELNVNEDLIVNALTKMKVDKVLPYRFIAAARYYPGLENVLESCMLKCLEGFNYKFRGKTILLLDVSGSMDSKLSAKSDMSRLDAACGLAILARELCENVKVFTFSKQLIEIPNRRGFALRDAIINSQPHKDTFMGDAISQLNNKENYNRLIVLSDEQTAQQVPNPKSKDSYMINVSNNQNGVGYRGNWFHVDGFSEAVLDFINAKESEGQ